MSQCVNTDYVQELGERVASAILKTQIKNSIQGVDSSRYVEKTTV